MAPPPLANLNEDQLRRLGKLIYYQEVEAIKDIKFESESELAKYLRDCKSGYQNVLVILDSSVDLKEKYKDDESKAPIAHNFATYMIKGVSTSLQCIRSFKLRMNYLEKIKAHSYGIWEALEKLDRTNVTNVARLAKEAYQYNQAMLKYNSRYQGLFSKLGKWLTEHDYNFEELVQRYQRLLNFSGAFKDLDDVRKLKVYNKIIEKAGFGEAKMTEVETMLGGAGTAVLLFTAGAIVWDIYTSDHKLQTAVEDTVKVLSSIGGSMIGELIGTTLSIELVGIMEVSPVVLGLAGFAAGIIAGYILSEIGMEIVHLIFGSGGSNPTPIRTPTPIPIPTPTPPPRALSTVGHRCYHVQLPDGQALARQIAHEVN